MRQLLFGTAQRPQLDDSVLAKMHRLRHRVFREKLRWNVSGENKDSGNRPGAPALGRPAQTLDLPRTQALDIVYPA